MMIPTALTGGAENVSVMMVSENYFDVLGATAIRGRVFESKDVQILSNFPSVLISENYWQRRFGSDPSILGRSIKLNGRRRLRWMRQLRLMTLPGRRWRGPGPVDS